jgi:hypothetical protein
MRIDTAGAGVFAPAVHRLRTLAVDQISQVGNALGEIATSLYLA